MKKKYMVVLIILLMLTVFGIVLGASYAFFTTTVKTKEFVIYTGNLAVDYTKKTDVVDIENLYPMTDEQGLEQPSHEFTVTNNGTLAARYQIRLELDDTIENIPIEYIKLSYKKDNGNYSEPILLSNLNSSLVFIKDAVITSNQSNTYAIKLWIDLNAPNDIQEKEFRARVVVDSIQNVEDGYVVDTVPIVTLNKDENGNQDIHLKVGETYTELGVKSIEDDKDILTVDEVEKIYEYYDGENLTTVNSIDTSKTGIYYITYSVTDSSNNKGTAIRIITVNKTKEIPTIELNGEEIIKVGETETYTELGVTVENNNQVAIIGEVKNKAIGTYIIRYIVIDENGNLNSVIRTVKVVGLYQEEILNGATPVLTNNLIPVQIADDGTVTKARLYDEWYDYETKHWANAVVLKTATTYANGATIPESNIESYFVWIPKYSYQLWDLGNYSSLTSINTSKPHPIPIRFGIENTDNSVTGECTTPGTAGASGSCQVGDYMTHPAFLAFDTTGLWVGKFETGYDGATSLEESQIDSSDSSKIIIKPNVYSWKSNTLGNIFKASYEYMEAEKSHMMKNTEWGAITYLSHSIYGTCSQNSCVEIRNNNGGSITGYVSRNAPTVGFNNGVSVEGNMSDRPDLGKDGTYSLNYFNVNSTLASTTRNYTGIYDAAGGTGEYVMGYTTGATTAGGSSEITTLYPKFFTDSSWNKYYDKYSSTSYLNFSNRILGDATGELGPYADADGQQKSSWYDDFALFIDSYPWFTRGGVYSYGTNAGIFAFQRESGRGTSAISFRIVLAP